MNILESDFIIAFSFYALLFFEEKVFLVSPGKGLKDFKSGMIWITDLTGLFEQVGAKSYEEFYIFIEL